MRQVIIENLLISFGGDAHDASTTAVLVMAVYITQKSVTDCQMKGYTQENGFPCRSDFATMEAITMKCNFLIENTADKTWSFNKAEFGELIFSSPPSPP